MGARVILGRHSRTEPKVQVDTTESSLYQKVGARDDITARVNLYADKVMGTAAGWGDE